jgi:serine/threonine protein kinase/Tol biopolymer transport system component
MNPGLATGTRLGPYEISGWIGAGGMGDVYRARDARLGRDVAIKLIAATLATDPSRVHRFEQEARAAGQLNHPNILAVYDTGVHEGVPYIVSELLQGESLRSRLRGGAMAPRKAADYARQIAEGLAAAHERGIVHRDVKPDNLFITSDGRIKILDFGIAKLTRSDDVQVTGMPTDTADGTVVGTTAYMSPEQVRGAAVDTRSDIFSVGSVLYEMLSGRPAFARDTAADTMAAILNDDAADAMPPAVPPALARIVSRCLEKGREARFQSARDLAFGLEVLTGASGTAPTLARARQRPLRMWAAAGTAIAIVSLAVASASWRRSPDAPSLPLDNPLALAKFSTLTAFEGTEKDAAISPDGRFVVFLSDRDGPFHIWLKQVGPGPFRNLTEGQPDQTNVGPNRSVGFSGDGGEIWINGTRARRMAMVPLMGGVPRVFLVEKAVNAAWSPDGSSLVYFTWDGDPLIVADRAGNNPRTVLPARVGDHNHFPAWSRDSRWIYYAHADQSVSDYDIWRIPSAGGTPERMTNKNTDIRYLTMIDARTLLYVAPDEDRSGPWLWALDVERKMTRRVSNGLERYLSVAASADGTRLVATVASSAAGLWTVPILAGIAETADVKPYPTPTTRALAPRFGKDSLFYLSSSGAGEGLWRMLAGDATEVWRGSDEPLMEVPAVSAKGDSVAVVSRHGGSPRLSVVSADGADRRRVDDTIAIRGTPAWSPDGNWIATGGTDASGPGLFKIPVGGGRPVRLKSGPASDPVWSPTGNFIVYVGQQDASAPLLAIRDDGTAMEFPPIRVPTGGRGRARFLPNGTGLVYLQGTGPQDFWLLDIASGRSRQLTRLSGGASTSTFDVSPDGTRIVFDRLREISDIVLIELPKPGAAAPAPASQ